MKILFIHNDYARPSGEEHAAEALAALLERQGHEVAWYRRGSVELEGRPLKRAWAFFTGIYNPKAQREVQKALLAFEPDLVQVQNLYPLISPAVLIPIRKAGIPIVMRCPNYRLFCPNGLHLDNRGKICEQCTGPGRELHCIRKNCERSLAKSTGYALRGWAARKFWKLHRLIDVFIVQTEFQREKFIANGIPREKVEIVPGLTPEIPRVAKEGIGELVSFVGRISPEKGIQEFLQAARSLPHIPFAVAGHVPGVHEKFKRDSPPNVKWFGFLKGAALDGLYQNTRIVIVPGKWYEGFPNVITQAMKHGKPVITSNLGAMGSIVDHDRNGCLVEPGHAGDLARAIDRLYGDGPRCRAYGENGREKALGQYSEKVVYSNLLSAYRSARLSAPHPKEQRGTAPPTEKTLKQRAMHQHNVQIMGYTLQTDLEDFTLWGKKVIVNTLNPHSYCMAKKDSTFAHALNSADILLPDGVGLVLATKFLKGIRIPKIAGMDMQLHLLKLAQEKGLRVFYLGSTEQTLALIAQKIGREYPNIGVAVFSPPFKETFSPADTQLMVEKVNAFKPDILFVGMTAPKQEKWVYLNKGDLDVKIIASIGAAFDFFAGTVKRSDPLWIKLGLEWLPRLIREPRRMARRNFVSTPEFLWEVMALKLSRHG